MTVKERRNTNKQVTVEKLDKKLDDAISERLKLAEAVEEIHEKVNFDGGLVYQCDLKELKESNAQEHKEIMEKLNLIFPVVENQIEKSRAYDLIADDIGVKFRSGKFWVQVIVVIGIITALAVYGIGYIKTLFKTVL